MSDYEERQKMLRKFQLENGRWPRDDEYAEIYAAVKQGRKTWGWT